MNRLKHLMTEETWGVVPKKGFDAESTLECDEPEWGIRSFYQSSVSSDFIRELANQLSGKTSENSRLQKRIDELSRRLDKQEQLLKQFFDPTGLPTYGTFEHWLLSDPAVNDFRGKHIAFVTGKGVIASADSLDALIELVEATGKGQDITVGFVPMVAASVSKC